MENIKEIKKDIKEIELQVIEMYNLKKINSSTINRYTVFTKYGNYNFYFDKDSIFGRFEDIKNYSIQEDRYQKVNGKLYKRNYNINPFTGKFNFHYNEVYDFIYELDQLVNNNKTK